VFRIVVQRHRNQTDPSRQEMPTMCIFSISSKMDQVRGQARCSKVCKRISVSTPACHMEVVRLQEANQRKSNGKKGTKGEIILQNMCQHWTVCIFIKEEKETPTRNSYNRWKGWYRSPHRKFAGFVAIRVYYIIDTTHVNVETFMQGVCGCPPRCTEVCLPILSENCTLCRRGRLGKATIGICLFPVHKFWQFSYACMVHRTSSPPR